MDLAEELAAKTLYVGNLAAGSNEALLRIIFEQCGPIASIRIAGRPDFDTCFAFVEFVDQGHAEFAKTMDGLSVGDRHLKVSTAKASSLARHVDRIMRNGPGGTSLPQIQANILPFYAQPSLMQAVQKDAKRHCEDQAIAIISLQCTCSDGRKYSLVQTFLSFVDPRKGDGLRCEFMQAQVQARILAATPGGPMASQPEFKPFNAATPLEEMFQPQYQLQPPRRPHMRPPPPAISQSYSSPRPLYPDPQPSYSLPGPPFLGSQPVPDLSDQYPPPQRPDYQEYQPSGQMAFRQRNQQPARELRPPHPNHSQRFVRPWQDPARVERTVFVENVAPEIDEQGLADHFGVCGEVTAVRIVGGEGGSRKAWLEFSSHRESRAAREYDQTSLGPNIIRVRPSKTAIHTNGLARNPFGRQRSVSPRRERNSSVQRMDGGRRIENGHPALSAQVVE